MSESNLLEKLAALEHEQWKHWTKHFLKGKHTPNDLRRWLYQIDLSYDELPEEDKEKDRVWARKVLEIMKDGK